MEDRVAGEEAHTTSTDNDAAIAWAMAELDVQQQSGGRRQWGRNVLASIGAAVAAATAPSAAASDASASLKSPRECVFAGEYCATHGHQECSHQVHAASPSDASAASQASGSSAAAYGQMTIAPPCEGSRTNSQPQTLAAVAQRAEHEEEEEEEDEGGGDEEDAAESLTREAERVMSRLPPNVRDSLRKMPSFERGMVVNTDNDEAIARVLAQNDQVTSADVISIGHRFDRKIRRIMRRVKAGMADEVSAIKEAFRPRVNISDAIEEGTEYMSGKQRLKERLNLYTLAEFTIKGDGDCQFSSLADQLYRNPGMAVVVRHTIVNYLRSHSDQFKQYVPGDFNEYCNSMDKRGTWGDHVTLQAAANVYGVEIHLLTSYKDTPWMEVKPQGGIRAQKSLWLSFLAELHYNSLYTQQDLASRKKAEEKLRVKEGPYQESRPESPRTQIPSSDSGMNERGAIGEDSHHHHCLLM